MSDAVTCCLSIGFMSPDGVFGLAEARGLHLFQKVEATFIKERVASHKRQVTALLVC